MWTQVQKFSPLVGDEICGDRYTVSVVGMSASGATIFVGGVDTLGVQQFVYALGQTGPTAWALTTRISDPANTSFGQTSEAVPGNDSIAAIVTFTVSGLNIYQPGSAWTLRQTLPTPVGFNASTYIGATPDMAWIGAATGAGQTVLMYASGCPPNAQGV